MPNAAFKSKDWTNLAYTLFVLTIAFFLKDYLYLAINKYLISYFKLDTIQSTPHNDAVTFLLIAFYIYYLVNHYLKKRLAPTKTFLALFGLYTVWYVVAIRQSDSYILTPCKTVPWIKYLDALFLFLTIPFIKFVFIPNPDSSPTSFSFIEDDFKIHQTPDLLGRKKYSLQIARSILSTKELDKSFVIAINSPWGFGKSAFLYMIKRYLVPSDIIPNADPSLTDSEKLLFNTYKSSIANTIIIAYNPWRNLDDKKIIKDFLDELSSAFKDYHSNLSGLIQQYSKYLSKLDDSTFTKVVESALESLKPSDSATTLYTEINQHIGQIKKRIVIFVDDLDRLNGNELIDVLKLIRNTANFQNTIFLVAYDHNYVLNTIDKSKLISNKEEYLQKIIQLEITLPTFDNNILVEFLKGELRKVNSLKTNYTKIEQAIIEISNIIMPPVLDPQPPQHPQTIELAADELIAFVFNKRNGQPLLIHYLLKNVRDAVRLINSLKITFNAIGDVGDPFEILLLEMIKTKYLSIYQLLSNRQLTKLGEKQQYVLHQAAFDYYMTPESCDTLNIRYSEKPVIHKCLNAIFSRDQPSFFRSVTQPQYFSLYFSYDSPNTLDLEAIENSLANNAANLPILLEQATEPQRQDIQSYIYSLKDFATADQYQSAVCALFHLTRYEDRIALSQLRVLLHDKTLTDFLYPHPNTLADFVLTLLTNKNYPLEARIEIASEELYKIVNRNDQFPDTVMVIRDKKKLQEVMYNCLEEATTLTGYLDPFSYNTYVKNLEDIVLPSRKIRITQAANKLIRELIKRDSYRYLKEIFLREHPEPSFQGKYFHFDPFFDYYFNENIEDEITYLNSNVDLPSFTDQDKKTYRRIINRFTSQPHPKPEKFFVDDKTEAQELLEFIKNQHTPPEPLPDFQE